MKKIFPNLNPVKCLKTLVQILGSVKEENLRVRYIVTWSLTSPTKRGEGGASPSLNPPYFILTRSNIAS